MDRTEHAIMDAFGALLKEKPLNKITVKDIVERCGVNRNTFYYHFQDIPYLLEQIVKERADWVIQNHVRLGEMMDCIELIVQYGAQHREALLNIYRSLQKDVFLKQLNDTASHLVREYVGNATEQVSVSEEDRQYLERYYKCIVVGVALDWLDADMRYNLVAATRRIGALFQGMGKRAIRISAGLATPDPSYIE